MRQVLATAHTLVGDLADRENVEGLLRRFYGRAFRDDMLSEPFAGMFSGGALPRQRSARAPTHAFPHPMTSEQFHTGG